MIPGIFTRITNGRDEISLPVPRRSRNRSRRLTAGSNAPAGFPPAAAAAAAAARADRNLANLVAPARARSIVRPVSPNTSHTPLLHMHTTSRLLPNVHHLSSRVASRRVPHRPFARRPHPPPLETIPDAARSRHHPAFRRASSSRPPRRRSRRLPFVHAAPSPWRTRWRARVQRCDAPRMIRRRVAASPWMRRARGRARGTVNDGGARARVGARTRG